jgi:hypothetical protein
MSYPLSNRLSPLQIISHINIDVFIIVQETDFFFKSNAKRQSTARFADCTLCVIKPHAVKEGRPLLF